MEGLQALKQFLSPPRALVMEGGYTWGPTSMLPWKAILDTLVKKGLGSDSPYLRTAVGLLQLFMPARSAIDVRHTLHLLCCPQLPGLMQ